MNQTFDAQRFLDDTRRLFTDPKGYFAGLPLEGGLAEPVIRAAIYGLAAGIVNLFWSLFGMGGRLAFGQHGVLGLVSMPLGAVVLLFVGGAVIWGVSALCGGSRAYESAVRIQAALLALYPLRAAINVFYAASLRLGLLLDLALAIYGVWLGYQALLLALRAEERKARVAAIAFAVAALLGALGS